MARLMDHQARLIIPVAAVRDERQPPEDGAVRNVPAQRDADVVAAAQPARVRASHRRPRRRARALAGHGQQAPRHQRARGRVRAAEVARELRGGALERELPGQGREHGAPRDGGLRHVPLLGGAVGVECVLLLQVSRRLGCDRDCVRVERRRAGERGGIGGGPWDGALGVDGECPASSQVVLR
jgi:hypothetical protein